MTVNTEYTYQCPVCGHWFWWEVFPGKQRFPCPECGHMIKLDTPKKEICSEVESVPSDR